MRFVMTIIPSNGYFRKMYCNKCTNNVISCNYNIINKKLIFIERIRNENIISDQYQLSVYI